MDEKEGLRLIQALRIYKDWNLFNKKDEELVKNGLIRTIEAMYDNPKKNIKAGDIIAKNTKDGYKIINKIDYPNLSK